MSEMAERVVSPLSYRDGMDEAELAFYRAPAAMSAVPGSVLATGLPVGPEALRGVVQGLLVHRDLAWAYGIEPSDLRLEEQQLRSTREVLARALELSDRPVREAREPEARVVGICRHFALLHTAFLRAQGVPARVRCGFGGYFEAGKWLDHWITEHWDGDRWVRHDPQIDGLQADAFGLDFDPYDQPAGRFLTGAEAWRAIRAGEMDAACFGIFDMWGAAFVAGNVLLDFACVNKVELLPWDHWDSSADLHPHAPVPDDVVPFVDELAALLLADDHDAITTRYRDDGDVRVPADITSYVDGTAVAVHLDL
jgi:hypothetical protein